MACPKVDLLAPSKRRMLRGKSWGAGGGVGGLGVWVGGCGLKYPCPNGFGASAAKPHGPTMHSLLK